MRSSITVGMTETERFNAPRSRELVHLLGELAAPPDEEVGRTTRGLIVLEGNFALEDSHVEAARCLG